MLKGLFQIIDNLLKIFSDLWDKGIFFIIAFIGIALFVLTIVIVSVVMIKSGDQDIPPEKQMVINQAEGYCRNIGLNNWHWKNESQYIFECFNSTETEDSLSKFYGGISSD